MKVAIIGAGLSGLACAHELKRQGITPVVYEKKSYIGEVLEFPVIVFHMFNVPVRDPLKYLAKKHNLALESSYPLNELVINTPNVSRTIRGNLGCIFRRDGSRKCMLCQITDSMDVPVKFNREVKIEDIRMYYDHVVVATGTPQITKEMNAYLTNFKAQVRAVKVKGSFKTDSIAMWLNSAYAKSGFGYLVANTQNEAWLILIVPNISAAEMDYYWNKFVTTENINYEIFDVKDLPHETGSVSPTQIGNVYFAGIAGGFIDDFLGFGSIKAILSGVMAGDAIANSLSYNHLTHRFIKDIQDKHMFRRALDSMEMDEYEKLVKFMAFPGIKQFIYNNPFLKITQGTFVPRIYNRMKSKSKMK